MRFKRLLALLLAAALALAVLVGCGSGQQSAARVLLNLLDGKYPNISVELDPDLEADLRQAVNEGETDAEIRAALEKLLGSGVSFRLIGDGQKGDSAWNLILYPGSDPDAAARSAYLEWDKIFSAFPSSGLYTAKLSMIETDNGYAILVQATVDKAASRNDDDDDEPEEPEEEIPESGYKKIDDTYKVYNSTGLTSVLFGNNDDSELATDRNRGFAGVTITLAANTTYTVSQTFSGNSGVFMGTLQGEEGSSKPTITLTGGKGLFGTIADGGEVSNLDIMVDGTISVSKASSDANAGAVAGINNGEISGCKVTISHPIQATVTLGDANAGGIVGTNESGGEISGCTVTIASDGKITASSSNNSNAGGIVGNNYSSGMVSCGAATGTDDNSVYANAYQDSGKKYIASVTTSFIDDNTVNGTTGATAIWPTSPATPRAYAGTQCGKDGNRNSMPTSGPALAP